MIGSTRNLLSSGSSSHLNSTGGYQNSSKKTSNRKICKGKLSNKKTLLKSKSKKYGVGGSGEEGADRFYNFYNNNQI